MLTIETKKATEDLKAAFRSLSPNNVKVATSRAINHTIAKTRTAVSSQIRSIYRMAASDIKDATDIKKSNTSTLTAYLMASATPLSLSKFNPVQNKGSVEIRKVGGKRGGFASSKLKRAGASGVTIEVLKGQKETIDSAFIRVFGSGKATVMARGAYTGNKFDFSSKRLPIAALNTKSIYFSAINDSVQEAVSKTTEIDYSNRLTHELTKGLDNTKFK